MVVQIPLKEEVDALEVGVVREEQHLLLWGLNWSRMQIEFEAAVDRMSETKMLVEAEVEVGRVFHRREGRIGSVELNFPYHPLHLVQ